VVLLLCTVSLLRIILSTAFDRIREGFPSQAHISTQHKTLLSNYKNLSHSRRDENYLVEFPLIYLLHVNDGNMLIAELDCLAVFPLENR